MTTGIEELKLPTKPKGRGLGKKPALYCTSLRLSNGVMEYFNANFPYTKQAQMREVLSAYVQQQMNKQELAKKRI